MANGTPRVERPRSSGEGWGSPGLTRSTRIVVSRSMRAAWRQSRGRARESGRTFRHRSCWPSAVRARQSASGSIGHSVADPVPVSMACRERLERRPVETPPAVSHPTFRRRSPVPMSGSRCAPLPHLRVWAGLGWKKLRCASPEAQFCATRRSSAFGLRRRAGRPAGDQRQRATRIQRDRSGGGLRARPPAVSDL